MKTMKKALFAAAVSAMSLFAASNANAAAVVWNLNNVAFDDGGTASGSFTYNADTNTYSSWSLSVMGGTTPAFPAFTYTDTAGFIGSHNVNMADFLANPVTRYLRLAFTTALTNNGGTIALTPTAAYECDNCSIRRNIVAGTVTTASIGAVPEPASWAMMIGGIGLIGGALRRRQSKVTTKVAFA